LEKSRRKEATGFLYGLIGVLGFSLTLPATRVAVAHFGAAVTGLGRPLRLRVARNRNGLRAFTTQESHGFSCMECQIKEIQGK
jgi:hypothetical protein